jgi:hypothetical protein
MPPPGWYPDPELAWTWRWWDGGRWTDLRAPQTEPPHQDRYSVSVWFEESVAAVWATTKRIGLVVVGLWLVVGVLSVILLAVVARTSTARELRSLLEVDDWFAPPGTTTTVELSAAEADRAVELLGDLALATLPWLVVLGLVSAAVSLWVTAVVARVADRAQPRAVAESGPPARRIDAAVDALRRVPAVLGSTIVLGLLLIVTGVIALVPTALAIALDLGAGATAVAVVFGMVAWWAVAFVVWVRLSLATVIAALGGHGIGIRRSWTLTDGHLLPVAGRLLIIGLVSGAITLPLSVVTSMGPAFGLGVYVAMSAVVQVVSVAASSLIGVPALVVLHRHLTERHAPRLGS